MPKYLIYFAQAYPNFRKAELESLADLNGVKIDLSHHDELNPFLIVDLKSDDEARKIMKRSILGRGIYELWGHGRTTEELHNSVQQNSSHLFSKYENCTFKFDFIGYKGTRSRDEIVNLIESFKYLAFKGKIRMKNPEQVFTILEEYNVEGMEKANKPINCWFGRQIQLSSRT